MDTSTKPSHIGRKISRIRELRGMKQEFLASELGVSQQTVSRMEASENVEDEVLEKIAKVLGVSSDAIKSYNDEAIFFHIQNMYESAAYANTYNSHCTFNPIDKLVEVFEENKRLYERLLQSEREKNEILKQSIGK